MIGKRLPMMLALLSVVACRTSKQTAPVPAGFGSAITIISGDKQINGVGRVLDDPVIVQVNDDKGAAVPGALVAFDSPDGMKFTPPYGLTGNDGQFTVSVALGGISGRSTMRAFTGDKSGKTAEVKIAGNLYRLVPVDDIQTTDDPAKDYDPAKALAAVEAGAGAFKGMDVEAFLAEILEAREQDTPGHSF